MFQVRGVPTCILPGTVYCGTGPRPGLVQYDAMKVVVSYIDYMLVWYISAESGCFAIACVLFYLC